MHAYGMCMQYGTDEASLEHRAPARSRMRTGHLGFSIGAAGVRARSRSHVAAQTTRPAAAHGRCASRSAKQASLELRPPARGTSQSTVPMATAVAISDFRSVLRALRGCGDDEDEREGGNGAVERRTREL